MWIVRVALNRPYTFIVVALLILILSPIVILRTPTDIFPDIDIPVIAVVWNYTGMSAEEMEGRMTSVYERVLTTLVNNIEHIESMTVNGLAVVKVFLQPDASVDAATAQITATSQVILKQMPPGVTPPLVITYNASSVPILQLGLSSKTLSEQQFNDLGLNFVRTQLVTIPGASIPYPYGGKATAGDGRSESRRCCNRKASRPATWSAAQSAESDSAFRHGQNWTVRIRRRSEREPQAGRRD